MAHGHGHDHLLPFEAFRLHGDFARVTPGAELVAVHDANHQGLAASALYAAGLGLHCEPGYTVTRAAGRGGPGQQQIAAVLDLHEAGILVRREVESLGVDLEHRRSVILAARRSAGRQVCHCHNDKQHQKVWAAHGCPSISFHAIPDKRYCYSLRLSQARYFA